MQMMKSRIVAVSALVLTLLMSTQAVAGNSSVPDADCGDLNNSGNLTTSDALQALKAAVGQQVPLMCDANSSIRVGNANELADTEDFSPGYLIGAAVDLPAGAVVTHLGLIARKAGPPYRIAMYTDDGGQPDQLVIGSETGNLIVGRQAIAVAPTSVPSGKYWLMANFETDAELSGVNDVQLAEIRFRDLAFTDPLPAIFGESEGYPGTPMNHFIKAIYLP